MAIPVLGFKSKKDCRLAVKAEVDSHKDTGREFYSKLVAQLFAERHYALSPYGIWPIGFRWGIHPRFNTPECFFIRIEDERFPNVWWRDASWNKCIAGWRLTDETLDAELADYYRRYAVPTVFRYRDSRYMSCEFPGCSERWGLEVHHVEPSFKVIAAGANALLTADERAALIAAHDWFSNEPWLLPDRCVRYIVQAHETAKLMLVCKQHHLDIARRGCAEVRKEEDS